MQKKAARTTSESYAMSVLRCPLRREVFERYLEIATQSPCLYIHLGTGADVLPGIFLFIAHTCSEISK